MDTNLIVTAYSPYFINLPVQQADARTVRRRALRAARLGRILVYVEAKKLDPDLSAHTAARALGMSVRSLHLALAPTAETFGELVARRRLAACQTHLSRPENEMSIAGIAYACGFNSLSSYYRAFRRAYGGCPRPIATASHHFNA